jgi:hypothetical protein
MGTNMVNSPVIPFLSAEELSLLVIPRFKDGSGRVWNSGGMSWLRYLGSYSWVVSRGNYAADRRDVIRRGSRDSPKRVDSRVDSRIIAITERRFVV